jgi:hypothetical protein
MAEFRSVSKSLVNTGDTVDLNVVNTGVIAVQISGTWTGTLTFTSSVNGASFQGHTGISIGSNSQSVAEGTSATSNSLYTFPTNGVAIFRVTFTATSGSPLVEINASEGSFRSVGVRAVNAATATAAGTTLHHLVAAATTNATSVKAAGGNLYAAYLLNTSATIKFVKFFNKASAPTVGTDTPVITIGIPPGTTYNLEGVNVNIGFSTGIAYAITGLSGDLDTTVVVAGDVIVSLVYA